MQTNRRRGVHKPRHRITLVGSMAKAFYDPERSVAGTCRPLLTVKCYPKTSHNGVASRGSRYLLPQPTSGKQNHFPSSIHINLNSSLCLQPIQNQSILTSCIKFRNSASKCFDSKVAKSTKFGMCTNAIPVDYQQWYKSCIRCNS